MSAAGAADITERVVIGLPPDREVPAYEVFRDRIRQHAPDRAAAARRSVPRGHGW